MNKSSFVIYAAILTVREPVGKIGGLLCVRGEEGREGFYFVRCVTIMCSE